LADLFPPDPEGFDLLHTREYEVRSFRIDPTTILLRGAVRDLKPAGMYVHDDPEPLTVHHMVVDMTVDVKAMTIVEAKTVMEVHPHTTCTAIIPHYDNLIGLSLSRGYNSKVRELFGGPRGCSHVSALLTAMGPIGVQTMWSLRIANMRDSEGRFRPEAEMTPEQRLAMQSMNVNSCHVWDEHGEHVESVRRGDPPEPPLWIRKRFEELGRDPADFFKPRT
jgi:Protein of unknown function (DUF2889)